MGDTVRTVYDTFEKIVNEQDRIIRERKEQTNPLKSRANELLVALEKEIKRMLNQQYPGKTGLQEIQKKTAEPVFSGYNKKTAFISDKIAEAKKSLIFLPSQSELKQKLDEQEQAKQKAADEKLRIINQALESVKDIIDVMKKNHKADFPLEDRFYGRNKIGILKYIEDNQQRLGGANLFQRVFMNRWERRVSRAIAQYNQTATSTHPALSSIHTDTSTLMRAQESWYQYANQQIEKTSQQASAIVEFQNRIKSLEAKLSSDEVMKDIREDFLKSCLNKKGLQTLTKLFPNLSRSVFQSFAEAQALSDIAGNQEKLTKSIEKFRSDLKDGMDKMRRARSSNPSYRTKIDADQITKQWEKFKKGILPQTQALAALRNQISNGTSDVRINGNPTRNEDVSTYPYSDDSDYLTWNQVAWNQFWQTYSMINMMNWINEDNATAPLHKAISDLNGADIAQLCRDSNVPELTQFADTFNLDRAFDGAGITLDTSVDTGSISSGSAFDTKIDMPSFDTPSIDIPSIDMGSSISSGFDSGSFSGGSFDSGGGGGFDAGSGGF